VQELQATRALYSDLWKIEGCKWQPHLEIQEEAQAKKGKSG